MTLPFFTFAENECLTFPTVQAPCLIARFAADSDLPVTFGTTQLVKACVAWVASLATPAAV